MTSLPERLLVLPLPQRVGSELLPHNGIAGLDGLDRHDQPEAQDALQMRAFLRAVPLDDEKFQICQAFLEKNGPEAAAENRDNWKDFDHWRQVDFVDLRHVLGPFLTFLPIASYGAFVTIGKGCVRQGFPATVSEYSPEALA